MLFATILKAQETSYVCSNNLPVNLSISECPGDTLRWQLPNGTIINSGSISATAAGTYTWTCKQGGTCIKSGTHILIIEPSPTLTINATDICAGTSQNISANGVPSGYTYLWNFDTGSNPTTSTAPSNAVIYSTAGSKTITLTLNKVFEGTENGCGDVCTWVITKNINVVILPGFSTCN